MERERQERSGDTWEIFLVGVAVIGAMVLCTGTMVSDKNTQCIPSETVLTDIGFCCLAPWS
jgi:hypothetical protein